MISLTNRSIHCEKNKPTIDHQGKTSRKSMSEPVQPSPRTTVREGREKSIFDTARSVFAEFGFKGATTAEIARRAGIPKANLHYYFVTKEALYRHVTEQVLTDWLSAASSFDETHDPEAAMRSYISAKMDLARADPLGSRIWASEILRGAPVIGDFLETTLLNWIQSRETIVKRWIAEGRLVAMEPRYFFYMIWASTQHYADFEGQMMALNGGKPLSDEQFETAKQQVIEMLLRGVIPPLTVIASDERSNPASGTW
jgi:TetR/AcrR family transcriptional regulator